MSYPDTMPDVPTIYHPTENETLLVFPIGTLDLENNVYLQIFQGMSKEELLSELWKRYQNKNQTHKERMKYFYAHNQVMGMVEQL